MPSPTYPLLAALLASIWVMARNRRTIKSRNKQIEELYGQLNNCEDRIDGLKKQFNAATAKFNDLYVLANRIKSDNATLRAELKRKHRRVPAQIT